LSTYAMMMMEQ